MASEVILVVEPSSRDESLWRFGVRGSPKSSWGTIRRNDGGGFEVERDGEHSVTALCLIGRAKTRQRIEYDLTWRPVPVETPRQAARIPTQGQMFGQKTLGERAGSERR